MTQKKRVDWLERIIGPTRERTQERIVTEVARRHAITPGEVWAELDAVRAEAPLGETLREAAERLAPRLGTTPDALIAEAERIAMMATR